MIPAVTLIIIINCNCRAPQSIVQINKMRATLMLRHYRTRFDSEDRSALDVSTVPALVTSTLTILLYYNNYNVNRVLLRSQKLWHLLKVDQSTDINDITQQLVSVRYFDNGVSEDILCLIPLKGITTAADICNFELDSLRCSVSELESRTCFLITALFISKLCVQKEATGNDAYCC